MKIEVTIEGQEPTEFKLAKDKTTIGSGEDCDYNVQANGISRKHVTIIAENDQYFVIDQGSTNGTFINEERLVPGQKVNFTSFFPVRLGYHVTLALVGEEEATGRFEFAKNLPQAQTQPSIVAASTKETKSEGTSPKGFGNFGTRTSTKVTSPKASSTKEPPKVTKKSLNPVTAMAVVIAVGGSIFFYLDREKPPAPVAVQKPRDLPPKVVSAQDRTFTLFATPDQGVRAAITDLKCSTDSVRGFCDSLKLPFAGYGMSGVASLPGGIVFVLPKLPPAEALKFFAEAYGQESLLADIIVENMDERDLAGLFLGLISVETWKRISPDQPWYYVAFVDDTGASVGKVYGAMVQSPAALVINQGTGIQVKTLPPIDVLAGFLRPIP